jgi:hypothetical protein
MSVLGAPEDRFCSALSVFAWSGDLKINVALHSLSPPGASCGVRFAQSLVLCTLEPC